jgi:hypothetical protein
MTENRKPVPYDTGKVKIGCMYQPRQQYAMSDFEYRLQETLLEKEDRALAGVEILCWIAATLLLVWLFMVAR